MQFSPLSAECFTVSPSTNTEICRDYKNLQTNFWIAGDTTVAGSTMNGARASEFLEFLTATSAAESSKKINAVGDTVEWRRFLGFQTFLENVHVEAAAEAALAAGISTEPAIAEFAYLDGFDVNDTPHARLLYYYAFWAAATAALAAWKDHLPAGGNQGFKDVVDKVYQNMCLFKDFGAAACGTFLSALELSASTNVELLERIFQGALAGMACILGVDVGEDEATRGMTNSLRESAISVFLEVNAGREVRRGLELPSKSATQRADDIF